MDYNIYREELAIKHPAYGHALWQPSPEGRYTSVEIGDVGFIRQGYFHRLFNILLPGDHPSHQDGVPQHHEPLVPEVTSPTITGTLQPGELCSSGVLDMSDKQRSGVVRPENSYMCTHKRGAILSLPLPALRKDTAARGDFARCMVRHIDEWVTFAQQLGLGISREDLILVTGCHLARTWATIAFQERRECVTFGYRASGISDVTWQFTPEGAHGVAHNLGPSDQDLPENQCIFIRGFRVTRFPTIQSGLQGPVGPAQFPDEDDINPTMQLNSIPDDTCYQDPLRTVLEYIATAALDCDMALVHDDDLQYVGATSLESLRPDTMMNYLSRSVPEIWKLTCDISTNHGDDDEGRSTPEAPFRVTVAALSKFDMAHELEPVIPRNIVQDGVTSSHRGFGNIQAPSYTGDIIPMPIMNAPRMGFSSSQNSEKRGLGDERLDGLRARDLLPGEVQSLVTENDLEEIEEKITLARELKVGLNDKSGFQKLVHAQDYHKAALGVYRHAKLVSDRALEQSGVKPQAGTSSELDDIYRRVLKTASTLYRCWLSCKDAFPTSDMKGKWAADVWDEACRRTKTRPNSSPRDEEFTLSNMKFLTKMKTVIRPAVLSSYGFDTGQAPDSMRRNTSLAQALLNRTTFMYREFNFGGQARYPFQHHSIQSVINVTWFNDRDDAGIVFHEYFTPIPIEVIGLALSVINCCIYEFSVGMRPESTWNEEYYKANYLWHLNSIRSFNNHNSKLLSEIQYDLLKNARIHAGAAAPSYQ